MDPFTNSERPTLMPILHACPRCTRLHPGRGRCPECERQYQQQRNVQPHRRAHRNAQHRRIRAYVLNRDGCCVDCGAVTDLTVDYVVPLSRGGTMSVANAATRCRRCNSAKGART